MNNLAIFVRQDLDISIRPDALELREAALTDAALIGKVSNPTEEEAAGAALKAIDDLLRLTEKLRKAVKQPFMDGGKKVDSKAAEYIEPLEADRTRLSRLIGDYKAIELAKVRAAEAEQRKDLEDIERQRQQELATALTFEARDEIDEKFNLKAAVITQPVLMPDKVDTLRTREDWDIEVINPYELARYHPHCVSISAKVGEIKLLLNMGITVHGVKAEKTIKTYTR